MKLINGFLDYSKPWSLPDVYLFTGNRTITKDGRLVMGRGAAKQVRDSYPGIDKEITIDNPVTFCQVSILIPDQILGYFQVKEHFRDSADLVMIEKSTECLVGTASAFDETTFHMNYPGIGAGHRDISEVEDIVKYLPDNVWLYK